MRALIVLFVFVSSVALGAIVPNTGDQYLTSGTQKLARVIEVGELYNGFIVRMDTLEIGRTYTLAAGDRATSITATTETGVIRLGGLPLDGREYLLTLSTVINDGVTTGGAIRLRDGETTRKPRTPDILARLTGDQEQYVPGLLVAISDALPALTQQQKILVLNALRAGAKAYALEERTARKAAIQAQADAQLAPIDDQGVVESE